MARPVRVDVAGGWYHVTARGIERRVLFTGPREHEHFLELLGEMSERHGVHVHAYVLMGTHYHLIVQTPAANASAALQWLNISYSVWFNRRHKRVGHVFQGRFGSKLIDGDGSWVLIASAYLHRNPVRVSSLGLNKTGRKAEARGYVRGQRETIDRRLAVLREHRWSSYGAYAGYGRKPEWLVTEELLRRAGGREAYRRYVESYVRQGEKESEFDGLKAQVVVGATEFVEKARGLVKRLSREQPDRKRLAAVVPFERIVAVVEAQRGRPWGEFRDEHGDWGRDLVLYLARRRSGLSLRAIGEQAGGVDYKAVSQAVVRLARRLERDRPLRQIAAQCLRQL